MAQSFNMVLVCMYSHIELGANSFGWDCRIELRRRTFFSYLDLEGGTGRGGAEIYILRSMGVCLLDYFFLRTLCRFASRDNARGKFCALILYSFSNAVSGWIGNFRRRIFFLLGPGGGNWQRGRRNLYIKIDENTHRGLYQFFSALLLTVPSGVGEKRKFCA